MPHHKPAPSQSMRPMRTMRIVIALEALGIAGVFGLYNWMDSSQDFRHTMNTKFPSVLEVYYKANELDGKYDIREKDREVWAARSK